VLGEITGRSVIAPEARKFRCGSRSIHWMATGLEAAAQKKLRKRAAKPMKSLARVNLCAGQSCETAYPDVLFFLLLWPVGEGPPVPPSKPTVIE
jgi:hypothetical protein